jgi:mono/diheme cytochrome c family protein
MVKEPVRCSMRSFVQAVMARKSEGRDKVPGLLDKKWLNGGTKTPIHSSISKGIISKGMPSWEGVLTVKEINQMVEYITAQKKK